MAVFMVSMRQFVERVTDVRIEADNPTEAVELAEETMRWKPENWQHDADRVDVQSISVKCEHPKAQCSPDPDGSGFECHACGGHNWIDVEVPV